MAGTAAAGSDTGMHQSRRPPGPSQGVMKQAEPWPQLSKTGSVRHSWPSQEVCVVP
jgi:hypothetical protein